MQTARAHAVEAHAVNEISPISPTVDFGTPPAPAQLTEDPHEMPWTMVVPSVVLAALAAVIGFLNMPFHNFEFLTEWLDPVFRGVEEHGPTSFVQGATLDVVSVTIACVGIFFAWTLYRRGLADPEVDPLDAAARTVRPRCSVTPTTSTTASRWLVDGPLRRGRAVARDRLRPRDHRRRGQRRRAAGARRRGRPAPGADRPGAPVRARDRARRRAPAALRARASGLLDGRLPDPHRDHRHADPRGAR